MCVHAEILFSPKKEENLAICNNMDDLEGILLSEISQTKKDKYHTISHVESKTKTKKKKSS